MKNGWIQTPANFVLSILILNGLLSPGTRQFIKNNLRVLYSPNEAHPDGEWSHVSISHHARYPTWDEILDARYSFFEDDAEVVQILPPKSEYINFHKNCFHLWSPKGRRITPVEIETGVFERKIGI